MNEHFKQIIRPFVRASASLAERITGFRTDPDSYLPSRIKMITGKYEESTLDALLSSLPSDGIFVDIGANVGYLSRAVLKKGKPSKVFAVEANPKLIPFLQNNLRIFSNVEIFPVALSDSEGEIVLYAGKDSNVSSVHEGYTEGHHNYSPKWISEISAITVKKTTADHLFIHLPKIDLMKIDIEGHELNALLGMARLFDLNRICSILFEYSPYAQKCAGRNPEELIQFFLQRNFQCVCVEGDFRGALITECNVEKITLNLGEKGYTSVLAQLQNA